MDLYAVRSRKDCGVDLESDMLSHGRLWYENESDAISYAKWNSRVKGGKIDVFNAAGELVRSEEFKPGDYAY